MCVRLEPEPDREVTLIAIVVVGGEEREVGVARYTKGDWGDAEAEFAIVSPATGRARASEGGSCLPLVAVAIRSKVRKPVRADPQRQQAQARDGAPYGVQIVPRSG
jgi:hypothetical protein